MDINSYCAGLYSEWWVAWAPGLGIHGDPGEGRGHRLAGGSTNSTVGSPTDEVLLYNSEEDEWTTVGHLSTARVYHAVSLVPANTTDYCL